MNFKDLRKCPVCGNNLHFKKLFCPECKAEFPTESPLSRYDYLDAEDMLFLETFLSCRGNLKDVQQSLSISYPYARRKLENILQALGLSKKNEEEITDMELLNINSHEELLASDIIRNKLFANGGSAVIQSISGKEYTVKASNGGKSFLCDDLPITPPYEFTVFDVIIDLLLKQGGKARKGNGRNYRLGEGECTTDTVIGAISVNYSGKKFGQSVFDPVFVLVSVLEWAGIAHNCRGYIELTAEYKSKIAAEGPTESKK